MCTIIIMRKSRADSIYKEIGSKITRVRKELNLTQSEIAHKLDIPLKTYATYEVATRKIPIPLLFEIAEILHLSPNELLGIEEKKSKPGPISRIERLSERIKKLPLEKQKKVIEHLEFVLHGAEKE